MARLVLVTGGARSGKTALAEVIARRLAGQGPLTMIATATPGDAEMAARIRAHQVSRGAGWHLIEAPLDLAGALAATEGRGARVIDCLTLWLANGGRPPDLLAALDRARAPVVLVSNELGQGIVPADPATRAFRDDHGRLNQSVAARACEVWLAVAGQPLRVKPPLADPALPQLGLP